MRACVCAFSDAPLLPYNNVLMDFFLLAWSSNHLWVFYCAYMYIEGSQVIISRYYHYLLFNQGLYCLPNFTHSACSGVTSFKTVNIDTMAGVIISRISLESSGGSLRLF